MLNSYRREAVGRYLFQNGVRVRILAEVGGEGVKELEVHPVETGDAGCLLLLHPPQLVLGEEGELAVLLGLRGRSGRLLLNFLFKELEPVLEGEQLRHRGLRVDLAGHVHKEG